MRYLRALWAAILAFLAALKQETGKDITQEAIDEVPGQTDEQLTDTAVDLGLVVRPDGTGGTGNPTD